MTSRKPSGASASNIKTSDIRWQCHCGAASMSL
jgi:hypothetical protein